MSLLSLNSENGLVSGTFPPVIPGPEMAAFYGHLGFLVSFYRKTSMPIELLVLDGLFWVLGGGGRFYFYGRGNFPDTF